MREVMTGNIVKMESGWLYGYSTRGMRTSKGDGAGHIIPPAAVHA